MNKFGRYSRCLNVRPQSGTLSSPSNPPICAYLCKVNGSYTLGWISNYSGFAWNIRRNNQEGPVVASGTVSTNTGTLNLSINDNGEPLYLLATGTLMYVVYPTESQLVGTLSSANNSLIVDVPNATNQYYYTLYANEIVVGCGLIPVDNVVLQGLQTVVYRIEVNGCLVDIPGFDNTFSIPGLIWFRAEQVNLRKELKISNKLYKNQKRNNPVQISLLWDQGESAGINWTVNGGATQSELGSNGETFLGEYDGVVVVVVNEQVRYEIDTQLQQSASLYVDGDYIKITSVAQDLPYNVKFNGGPVVQAGFIKQDLIVYGQQGKKLEEGTYTVEVNGGLMEVGDLFVLSSDNDLGVTIEQGIAPDYTVYMKFDRPLQSNEYYAYVYNETGSLISQILVSQYENDVPILKAFPDSSEVIDGQYLTIQFKDRLYRYGPLVNPQTAGVITCNITTVSLGSDEFRLDLRWSNRPTLTNVSAVVNNQIYSDVITPSDSITGSKTIISNVTCGEEFECFAYVATANPTFVVSSAYASCESENNTKTPWFQALSNGIYATPSPSIDPPGVIAVNLLSSPDNAVRGTAFVTNTRMQLATDSLYLIPGITNTYLTTNALQGFEVFGTRQISTFAPVGLSFNYIHNVVDGETTVEVTWQNSVFKTIQFLALIGTTPLDMVNGNSVDVTGITLAQRKVNNSFNSPFKVKVVFDGQKFDGSNYVSTYVPFVPLNN